MVQKKVVEIMLRVDEWPVVKVGATLQETWKKMGKFYSRMKNSPLNEYRLVM